MKKKKAKTNARAIIGLILILLSYPLLFVYYVGILTGELGLVLTFFSKKEDEAFSDASVVSIILGTIVVALGMTLLIISLGYKGDIVS